MKRCRFGLILLVLLLAVSAGSSRYMAQIHDPLAKTAAAAAEYALKGDWGNALSLTGKIRSQWANRWGIAAAIADHEPMEQVNSLLAQLEVHAAAGDSLGFASVCAALSAALDALGEGCSLTWWNLL